MPRYAIALAARNPTDDQVISNVVLAIPGMRLSKPSSSQVSCAAFVALAEDETKAEEYARRVCQDIFPAAIGWIEHTHQVLDLSKTLLELETG